MNCSSILNFYNKKYSNIFFTIEKKYKGALLSTGALIRTFTLHGFFPNILTFGFFYIGSKVMNFLRFRRKVPYYSQGAFG